MIAVVGYVCILRGFECLYCRNVFFHIQADSRGYFQVKPWELESCIHGRLLDSISFLSQVIWILGRASFVLTGILSVWSLFFCLTHMESCIFTGYNTNWTFEPNSSYSEFYFISAVVLISLSMCKWLEKGFFVLLKKHHHRILLLCCADEVTVELHSACGEISFFVLWILEF